MMKAPLPLATAIGGVALAFTELEASLKECCIALAAIRGVDPMVADVLVRRHDIESLAAILTDMAGLHTDDADVVAVVGDIAADVRRVVRRRDRFHRTGPGIVSVACYTGLRSETRDVLSTVLALTEHLHDGDIATPGFTPAAAVDNVVPLRPELRIVT